VVQSRSKARRAPRTGTIHGQADRVPCVPACRRELHRSQPRVGRPRAPGWGLSPRKCADLRGGPNAGIRVAHASMGGERGLSSARPSHLRAFAVRRSLRPPLGRSRPRGRGAVAVSSRRGSPRRPRPCGSRSGPAVDEAQSAARGRSPTRPTGARAGNRGGGNRCSDARKGPCMGDWAAQWMECPARRPPSSPVRASLIASQALGVWKRGGK